MVLATSSRGRLELAEVVLELGEEEDGLVEVGTWVVVVGERGDAGTVADGIVRRADILAYLAGGCADLDGAERGHTALTAWPRGPVGEGCGREDDVERELVAVLEGLI